MSDDQSFYEIQLNTPHLVLAFLGAAVVGVAIFWLGVVIGRGQSQPGGTPEWQGAVPAEASGDNEAADNDPLEFYEAVGEPVAGDEAAAPGGGEQSPPPAEQAQPEQTGSERDFRPAAPVDEERAPVASDSAATPSPQRESAPGAGLPRADPSLVTGWIVQVASEENQNTANALQAALVVDGFPAFVVSAEVNGTMYYRVRVGRYPNRSEAEQVNVALLRRSDIETSWVTEG
jgi:cell division septation protein DedD